MVADPPLGHTMVKLVFGCIDKFRTDLINKLFANVLVE